MSRRKLFYWGCFLCAGITVFLCVRSVSLADATEDVSKAIASEETEEKDGRAMLRAFYTAPPVIPHDVESQDSEDCLLCHQQATRLDDGQAALQIPHPLFSSCLQCHVPGAPGKREKVESSWEGLEEPKRGDRWFTVSPPTVPHRIFMRENCLSCHGSQNSNTRLRTPHPQRTRCLQCHAPNRSIEF